MTSSSMKFVLFLTADRIHLNLHMLSVPEHRLKHSLLSIFFSKVLKESDLFSGLFLDSNMQETINPRKLQCLAAVEDI